MSDLVTFLRARYAEAREAESGKRKLRGGLPFDVTLESDHDGEFVRISRFQRVPAEVFFERHGVSAADPVVLADLDAKLGILNWFDVAGTSPELNSDAWQIMRQVVMLLAVPFAAHPDYDERWRP